MRRREFLESTAASVFALAGGARGAAPGTGSGFPAGVSAILETGEVKLQSGGRGRWSGAGVSVQLSIDRSTQRVDVEAPRVALRALILAWPSTSPDLVLNDHWERSYGDLAWQAPSATRPLPWYFLAKRGNALEAFGVSTGGATLCSWQIDADSRRLVIDATSGGVGVHLGSRVLRAAEIHRAHAQSGESPFQLLRRFVRALCERPRLPAAPVYGINDWYFAYGKNSDALIRQHTEIMAPFADGLANRPFSVIDAGWFTGPVSAPDDCCFGADMRTPNSRFRDMSALTGDIRRIGMRPGLWTRPLCATPAVNSALLLPTIQNRADPARPILDPTIPENLERIAAYFELYRQWGFELVKIDFTTFDILGKWGFEMLRDRELTPRGWRMHDVTRTNAEIIRDLYAALRKAAGDMLLIGCNTVSHLSAGVFELNRIGDDTSGREWARTRKMGVNALAFRGVHHGAFYAADADCVGITTQVPWDKNRQWMDLVARSGTPLFISAQPDAVGPEQKPAIRAAFEIASRPVPLARPLDWMSNAWPREWALDNGQAAFDW